MLRVVWILINLYFPSSCRELGYYGVFTLSTFLVFLGITLCEALVHETITDSSDKPPQMAVAGVESSQGPKKLILFADLFNFKEIKSILVVITRKRTDKKRIMLHLCYLLIVLGTGPAYGKLVVNYLRFFPDNSFISLSPGQTSVNYFFTRHQFNYNEVQYSIFSAITSFLAFIGK